ncbi:hypothetical protein LINPERHAP2_LOCUS37210 [Linum perenne]
MGRFRIDPELNTRHLVKEIGLTYGLEVTVRVCANARKEARRILEGTLAEQYAKMRSYVSTLQLADPDGLFALEVDPVPGTQTSKFKRLYVGFSSLRLGFLSGCRRMFALDGCFLKGEVKGMLLSAVGKDGNNQMFPIAWAVVEGENRNSWCWFVHLVKTELLIADGTGWSIISDQQKGLVEALNLLLPCAEHRKCARHVSANWKIKHKSELARKAFWDAVYSSNVHDFKIHLAELEQLQTSGVDPGCFDDFKAQDYTTFSRAYVSRTPKCDSIESNICETFNGCIVKWRGLRILNMLEGIRGYMMSRIVNKVKMFDKHSAAMLCPRVSEKTEKGKLLGRGCVIRQALDLVCECALGDNGYVVDMGKRVCTCGYWELSGIPCVHAIAVASFLRKDITCFVDMYYTIQYARQAYGFGGIPAIPGQQAWEATGGNVLLPPIGRVMPGRPKKNRRKEQQELEVRAAKNGVGSVITRKGLVMHCKKCKKAGHNSRKCKEPEGNGNPPEPPQVPPTRTRRPREEQPAEERTMTRRVKCGKCKAFGHNARTCTFVPGVQV